jgi:replicative DNA helicase
MNSINSPYPSSLEAEKCVLSAMVLASASVVPKARDLLRTGHFELPAHRILFDLIVEKVDRGEPVETISIQQTLIDRHQLEKVGGAALLLEIREIIPLVASWEYYADVVLDKAARRAGMDRVSELFKAFLDTDVDWKVTVAEAQSFLSELLGGRQKLDAVSYREMMMMTMELLQERIENQGKIVGGLCTGFTELDRMFLGLSAPSIVTIAGRPSMGKSVLLQGIAERIAGGWGDYEEFSQAPGKVLFISTEMNVTDLGQRSVAARSGVNIKRFSDGFVKDLADVERARLAADDLAQIDCHVVYLPGVSAEQIAGRIHAWDSRHPETVAYVIDHMTDVGCDGVKDKGNQTAITTMAWSIVGDAIKRVNKVGFLGCQLNRDAAGRMPSLHDLRQSGKIEEVSSHVVLLHRQWYYELAKEEDDRNPNVEVAGAVFMVGKNRNGRRGPVPAIFDADITRFRSVSRRLYTMDQDERQEKTSFANR